MEQCVFRVLPKDVCSRTRLHDGFILVRVSVLSFHDDRAGKGFDGKLWKGQEIRVTDVFSRSRMLRFRWICNSINNSDPPKHVTNIASTKNPIRLHRTIEGGGGKTRLKRALPASLAPST